MEKRVEENPNNGRLSSFHVVAENIPEAFYKAVDVVWHHGVSVPTEYDRPSHENKGVSIDPPSKEASVLIEIKNPFAQPRYPLTSFVELGKYIAEIMGAKDHLVIPYQELKQQAKSGLISTKWPYTYHQRLFLYPTEQGPIDQVTQIIERLAHSPISRRAIATTRLPLIDAYIKEDLPCLGELQLRPLRDKDNALVLNMSTRWRSRDLYKAWPDNVIALTFLQQVLAQNLQEKSGIKTLIGSYTDFSTSLHIYGQDFRYIQENKQEGKRSFFTRHSLEEYVKKSHTSEKMLHTLILPQLEELLREQDQWNFTEESKNIINNLIGGLQTGRYIA